MNSNTYGKLLLSGVSFTSISAMSYLIYEDTKRQYRDDFIQYEETNDIILSNSKQGSLYITPYIRSYSSTNVNPNKINEKILPAVNCNYDHVYNINNRVIISNLEDNVYIHNIKYY